MKPNWDEAPEWANYLAMDESGLWYWHEGKPYSYLDQWLAGSRCQKCQSIEWTETLEQRPSAERDSAEGAE